MALALPAISSPCCWPFSFLSCPLFLRSVSNVFPTLGSPWKHLPPTWFEAWPQWQPVLCLGPSGTERAPSLCPSPLVYIKRYMHILFISVWGQEGQTLGPLCSHSLVPACETLLFSFLLPASIPTPPHTHTQRFLWGPASFLCPRCE